MSNEINPLVALSNAMVEAVEHAGSFTVLVDARRHRPASGIAFSTNLVLTADHVVERDEDFHVLLPTGARVAASLVGRDPGSDLALLRLNEGTLAAAKPAPGMARLGQIVLAIGRPSEDGLQASLGVISAIGGPVRTEQGNLLQQYIRTDAIPYPGFSGGPLIDSAGQLLGLNTSGAARGIAITIPASLAWKTAQTLSEHGHIRRGYLGIRSQPVVLGAAQLDALQRNQQAGLLIVWIEEDSPASQAGMLVGDILVGLDGETISDPDQLFASLASEIAGKTLPVELLRGGQVTTLHVTIGERK